jgi:hypothetical protein
MTVQELIDQLKTLDPNALIILSKDAEGNEYSPCQEEVYPVRYEAVTSWYGNIGFSELTDQLIEEGYTEEDLVDGVSAIVLYPVN